MLNKIKAKRDAIRAEIVAHQDAIVTLSRKCDVYDEIIAEEESENVVAAPEEAEIRVISFASEEVDD